MAQAFFSELISGSLQKTVNSLSYLVAGSNITIVTQSNGQILIDTAGSGGAADVNATYIVMSATGSLPNERVLTAGTGISLTDGGAGGNATLAVNNSDTSILSGSIFTGVVKLNVGASGSITKLTDGRDYIIAGTGILITSQSNGQISISTTGGGTTGADQAASYVVMSTTASLPNERALTAGTGISLTDGGAGGNATLAVNNSIVSVLSGSIFTGVVNLNAGASGSITKLTDGRDYIAAGSNITIVSASNGSITISSTAGSGDNTATYVVLNATSSLTNERVLTTGTGISLTDGGANSTETIAINNSVVATLSGSTYTGIVNLNAGASGSITKLTDGRDYIAAGAGILIASQSNGQITISTFGTGSVGNTGTTSANWTISTDATSSLAENPRFILIGGDGVSAPNNDLIRSTFVQSSSVEYTEYYIERNRNAGGYVTISPVLQIGKTGDTTNIGNIGSAATTIVIGGGKHNINASDSTQTIGIGHYVHIRNGLAVVIGHNAASSGSATGANVVIGNGAISGGATAGNSNVVIGCDATIPSAQSSTVAIGDTQLIAGGGVGIGQNSNSPSGITTTTFIGRDIDATTAAQDSIAFGSNIDPDTAGQLIIGGTGAPITTLYVGEGVLDATPPTDVNFGVTGGTGTNIAGHSMTIAGGLPTGTGIGGSVTLKTPGSGSAAETQNTLINRYSIAGKSGSHIIDLTNNLGRAYRIREGNQDYFNIDTNNSAGQTPSIVFGASGSGGGGIQDIIIRGTTSSFITHRSTGSEWAQLHTTGWTTGDATETTFWQYTLAQGEAMNIELNVLANNASDTASYTRIATARRDTGGSAEIIGSVSTPHTAEAAALSAANVNITGSNNDVQVRITGVAAIELNWLGWIKHQHQIK